MTFGYRSADFQHRLDPLAHRHRCAFCGGGAFSWVLTREGFSICTSCYQAIRNALPVPDSATEEGFPWPKGVSDA